MAAALMLGITVLLGTVRRRSSRRRPKKDKAPAPLLPRRRPLPAAPAKKTAPAAAAPRRAAKRLGEAVRKGNGHAKDKDGKDEKKELNICLTHHERLDGNTGMVLVSAAVRQVEGQDKQHSW